MIQCQQANVRLGRNDCCDDVMPAACDTNSWPQFRKHGFDRTIGDKPMPWDKLQRQLYCQCKPFAWTWTSISRDPANATSHMCVVFGYQVTNGVSLVRIHDTWPPDDSDSDVTRYDSYEYYRRGDSAKEHLRDYYDITWTGTISDDPETGTPRDHAASPPHPVNTRRLESQAATVAHQSLATFPALVNERNYRALGFGSPGQARDARVGKALIVYTVLLDELRDYRPGNATAILKEYGKIIYPVTAGETGLSGMVLNLRDGRWQTDRYGDAALIRLITRTQRSSVEHLRGALPEYSLVEMPLGPNFYFVSHLETNQWMLTPLLDDPRAGLKAGQDQPADRVFSVLAPVARATRGLQ